MRRCLILFILIAGCASDVEAPVPAPEPTVAAPVPSVSGVLPIVEPIADNVLTCTTDPCENVACKTADGQAWLRDYQTCTCTCKVPN